MSHTPKVNRVYVALIEVRPLVGCQIDPEEYEGAAVRCYIPAASEAEARVLLDESLEAHYLELKEVEFFVNQAAVEWEKPEDSKSEELSGEALASGEVVYGEFYAWEHGDYGES
jgi:hypothetical protein